jgi:hypothetical protein
MAVDAQVERRLTAVEDAVGELQRRLAYLPPTDNWLERLTGSFKDEPAFDEVLEYGRALRSSGRLPVDTSERA